jgi:hypothetical protein
VELSFLYRGGLFSSYSADAVGEAAQFGQDLESERGERHLVFLAVFREFRWNRPYARVKIKVPPVRGGDFSAPLSGNEQELESQLGRGRHRGRLELCPECADLILVERPIPRHFIAARS